MYNVLGMITLCTLPVSSSICHFTVPFNLTVMLLPMPLSVPLVFMGSSMKSAESLVMLLDAQLSIKIGYESVSNCA